MGNPPGTASFETGLLFICASTMIMAIFVYLVFFFTSQKRSTTAGGRTPNEPKQSNTGDMKKNVAEDAKRARKNKKEKRERLSGKEAQQMFTHPWILATLKGHSEPVLNVAFSQDNQYLASIGQDRAIFLWLTKDFTSSDHKRYRVNMGFNEGNQICFSPDNKAFMVAKTGDTSLEVYKIAKNAEGTGGVHISSAMTIKSELHKSKFVGLGIACNGKFMMSCSEDGQLCIWNLKGLLLEELKVGDGTATQAKIGYCGRFVGVCGKFRGSPNLVIYAVMDDTVYQPSMKRRLKIHAQIPGTNNNNGFYCFDFNADSTKVVALGTDYVWKLFDLTGNRVTTACSGSIPPVVVGSDEEACLPVIRLSKDGLILLIGAKTVLYTFSIWMGGKLLGKIEGIHLQEPIRDILFSDTNKFFVTCGDRLIRIFHNVPGMRESRRHMEHIMSQKSTSPALRTRLKNELAALEEVLKSFPNEE